MGKKVMLVGPVSPPFGGVETWIEWLLESDLKKKFDLVHFSIRKTKGSEKSGRFSAENFWHSGKQFVRFSLALLRHRPRLAHIAVSSTLSGFLRDSVFVILARFSGAKVIGHVHGGFFEDLWNSSGRSLRGFIVWNLGLCERVAVLSEYWARFFRTFLEKRKVIPIENGVDCEAFKEILIRDDALRENITILFMGSIGETKGVFDIVSCAAEIGKETPGIKFVLVGSDEKTGDGERIRRFTEEVNARSSVRFLGPRYGREKLDCFIDADVFILPSYFEGFPIVLLEAMACGLPVVASNISSIPEIVEDDRNGFLIRPGDRDALKEKLLLLAKDSELRKRIGETNKKDAKEKFDLPVMIGKIERLYRELLS